MPPKRKVAKRSKKSSKEEIEEKEVEIEEEEEEGKPPSKKKRTSQSNSKEDSKSLWNQKDTLWYLNDPSVPGSKKIIGFDMDATLIIPKSGKFPQNRNDWKWWHESVPKKIKSLASEGFRIVIFSNQAGVEKGKQNVDHLKGKILDLQREVKYLLLFFRKKK